MSLHEIPKFTMSIDPKDRSRAYVTSHGNQNSFINNGDMYAMAAEYASYLSNGAVKFIRKDGKPAPIVESWNPVLWLKSQRFSAPVPIPASTSE